MNIPVKSPGHTDQSLLEGGIYIVHSGDEHSPYAFVKLIHRNGAQIGFRAHPTAFSDWPDVFDTEQCGEPVYITVSLNVFQAWGPPKLPTLVAFEPVSQYDIDQFNNPDA